MKNPNGFGYIKKLSGKRRRPYAFIITTNSLDGKQDRKYMGYFETKKEALAMQLAHNEGRLNVVDSDMTFREVFNLFKKSKFDDIGQSSRNGYIQSFKTLSPLHGKKFHTLTRSQLQGILDDTTASYSTKAKIRTLLNQMYLVALDERIVFTNFAQRLKIGKEEPSDRHRLLSRNEVTYILTNMKHDRVIAYLGVLLLTGMRVGELNNILVENVNLMDRYMIGGSKTKSGIDRVIPIVRPLVPFIEQNMGNKYLFERDGKKLTPTMLQDWIRGGKKQHNLDHSNHSARVTFITLLTEMGVAEIWIQQVVGHKGQSVTQSRYTKPDPGVLVDQVDKLLEHEWIKGVL